MQGPREVIRMFQSEPDVRVFLLTRGHGAAGLTLTQGVQALPAPRRCTWPPLMTFLT